MPDPVAEMSPVVTSHFNDDHPDTLLFVARVLFDRPDAAAAVALAVDRNGIDIEVHGENGPEPLRIAFTEQAADLDAVQAQAISLVRAARAQSGEDGQTSFERQLDELNAIKTFLTEVVRVEQITPVLRQVTFGGGDLVDFIPAGPDQFLYLLVPPRGRTELSIGRDFSWEQYQQMPADDRPVGAYYTVRRWRPEVHEIDMLFVLHGDEGEGSAWAMRAQPGDRVALWGPRVIYAPPVDTEWYLLVGDETGLPAIGAILESLPAGTKAEVFVDVADEAEQTPLPTAADANIRWLPRDGVEAGTHSALVDAVRALPWPEGHAYAWGGGESRAVTAVRKYLRKELGLAREQVSMTGYWRHATASPDDLQEEHED
jgi:NADPH-dependent ferric siderophore reductase